MALLCGFKKKKKNDNNHSVYSTSPVSQKAAWVSLLQRAEMESESVNTRLGGASEVPCVPSCSLARGQLTAEPRCAASGSIVYWAPLWSRWSIVIPGSTAWPICPIPSAFVNKPGRGILQTNKWGGGGEWKEKNTCSCSWPTDLFNVLSSGKSRRLRLRGGPQPAVEPAERNSMTRRCEAWSVAKNNGERYKTRSSVRTKALNHRTTRGLAFWRKEPKTKVTTGLTTSWSPFTF